MACFGWGGQGAYSGTALFGLLRDGRAIVVVGSDPSGNHGFLAGLFRGGEMRDVEA